MKEKLFRPRYGIVHLVVFTWILIAIFMNMAYAREQALKREFAQVLIKDKWRQP